MPHGIGATLAQKLHPNRFPLMSPKMAAIVAFILGENWTEPSLDALTITADGCLVSATGFLGAAVDLEENIAGLIDAAGLSAEERSAFHRLRRRRITDWRQGITVGEVNTEG